MKVEISQEDITKIQAGYDGDLDQSVGGRNRRKWTYSEAILEAELKGCVN